MRDYEVRIKTDVVYPKLRAFVGQPAIEEKNVSE
jgi:hypothetical protein